MNYVSVTFKIPISSLVSNELWGDVNWLCKWTTLKCKEAEFNVFGLLDKRSLPKSRRQNFGFWPMGGSLTLNLTFFLQNIRQLNTWFFWALPFVGKGKYTKSMIFWKNSKRPSTTPPLIFGKLYCKLFMTDVVAYICKEIWWLDSMKCMHMISRYWCSKIVEKKHTVNPFYDPSQYLSSFSSCRPKSQNFHFLGFSFAICKKIIAACCCHNFDATNLPNS